MVTECNGGNNDGWDMMTASYLPTTGFFLFQLHVSLFLIHFCTKHFFRYWLATDNNNNNNNISCMHHHLFSNATIHFPIPPSIFHHLYPFPSNTTHFPTTLHVFQHHHTFYNATTHFPPPLSVFQHHNPFWIANNHDSYP